MCKKCLMTASTLSHLTHFHTPYIEEFRRMDWEVHVAGMEAGAIKTEVSADKIIPVRFEKSFFSMSNFRASLQLRKLMKRENYDLIICHTSLAAFFTRLAILGIKKETRLVNVVHGYLFDDRSPWYKSAILKSAEYLVASVTDLVLTMNEWDHQWAKNHKVAAKVGVIPGMGLGPEKMKKAVHSNCFEFKDGDFLLIYPAEFWVWLNQAMLIRAMTKLPENIRLILPGDGLLKEECMEFAHELGTEGRD